jgi:hypothetical protein
MRLEGTDLAHDKLVTARYPAAGTAVLTWTGRLVMTPADGATRALVRLAATFADNQIQRRLEEGTDDISVTVEGGPERVIKVELYNE